MGVTIKVRKNDFGFPMPVNIDLDTTDSELLLAKVTRKDSTTFTRAQEDDEIAIVTSNPGSSDVTVMLQDGDFPIIGKYTIQFKDTTGGINKHSAVYEFVVEDSTF